VLVEEEEQQEQMFLLEITDDNKGNGFGRLYNYGIDLNLLDAAVRGRFATMVTLLVEVAV
jgi:hypothetical protein